MKPLVTRSKMNFTSLNLNPINEHESAICSQEQKHQMGCKKRKNWRNVHNPMNCVPPANLHRSWGFKTKSEIICITCISDCNVLCETLAAYNKTHLQLHMNNREISFFFFFNKFYKASREGSAQVN
ncbi:hypothetical protein SO802_025081 [Lithocarpus litseifolius]|uniref:C2H2-type domain-containing protein n=1 Tax=Lithocarpus litseifolius TaxID=425828 RepID=A0AAW2BW47_9ROSI